MMRVVYRGMLWLHPPAFRRRFAEEMLWIFDASVAEGGAKGLLRDAGTSLLRQWVVRSRLWMAAVALLGAFATMMVANATMRVLFRRVVLRQAGSPQELFLFTVALAVLIVTFTLIAAVIPVLRVRRRRA